MGKTIEIRLSDAQHAALIAEAASSNRHLFDYCRAKLMAPYAIDGGATQRADHAHIVPAPSPLRPRFAAGEISPTIVSVGSVDRNGVYPGNGQTYGRSPGMDALPDDARMSRIEDTLARLSEYVLGGHEPAEPQPHPLSINPIDVDSMVSAQFAEAEAQGLAEHVPDEAEIQMAQSGVRSLSRRPIPFSASSGPRHLRELG